MRSSVVLVLYELFKIAFNAGIHDCAPHPAYFRDVRVDKCRESFATIYSTLIVIYSEFQN